MTTTINASTTLGLQQTADTSGVLALQTAGTTAVTIDASQKVTFTNPIQGGSITSGTAVASTSGTSIDFTGIPSWVKRITVMFNGVSLSSTATLLMQLGVSGTATTSGYVAGQIYVLTSGAASGGTTSTSGFPVQSGAAAYTLNGSMTFTLLNTSTNIWSGSGVFYNQTTAPYVSNVAGVVTLSGVCNMVRITSTSTDTFDVGSINILYEG